MEAKKVLSIVDGKFLIDGVVVKKSDYDAQKAANDSIDMAELAGNINKPVVGNDNPLLNSGDDEKGTKDEKDPANPGTIIVSGLPYSFDNVPKGENVTAAQIVAYLRGCSNTTFHNGLIRAIGKGVPQGNSNGVRLSINTNLQFPIYVQAKADNKDGIPVGTWYAVSTSNFFSSNFNISGALKAKGLGTIAQDINDQPELAAYILQGQRISFVGIHQQAGDVYSNPFSLNEGQRLVEHECISYYVSAISVNDAMVSYVQKFGVDRNLESLYAKRDAEKAGAFGNLGAAFAVGNAGELTL
jgi:hypothetical protein